MNTKNIGNLLFAAAVGGGLYWASKQPGGVKGTWSKFNGKLKEVQNSNDPLGTLKQQFNDAKTNMMATSPSSYNEIAPANQI